MTDDAKGFEEVLAEHAAIRQAIANRQPNAAGERMGRHLAQSTVCSGAGRSACACLPDNIKTRTRLT